MSIVAVNAASGSYEVLVDELPLNGIGSHCAHLGNFDTAFIVSDTNVAPLYADTVQAGFASAGFPVSRFVFEAGEQSKNLDTLGACLQEMANAGLTRSSLVVALGGGVVGDLAGFAAASYMRGISCVQVPTSLLACVDSSVGGKTAVDLPQGKNLVGAFMQPKAVFINTEALSTLTPHFFKDGCAEVLKYGVIFDADFFDFLEKPLVAGDERLAQAIKRCVELKRDVVAIDEKEQGLRQVLNFGHTLGHSIEKLSNFDTTHGFAVACGMALAAKASCARGWTSEGSLERLLSTLQAYGFSTSTNYDAQSLYEAALADKKRHGSTMNIVVSSEIGEAHIESLALADFEAFCQQATN